MTPPLARRQFLGRTVAAAGTLATAVAAAEAPRRIRVGVIGCGSVSGAYLPHLVRCPFAELVSVCDIVPARAAAAARAHGIAEHHPDIEAMLGGAAFDLFVNLTDMQEHERLNRRAIEAGRHVWSEKPIANSVAAAVDLLALAKRGGTRLWAAPTTVASPQFATLAKLLEEKRIGRVAAAHSSYGHTGPDWAAFFYEKGGGSLPDLGVYPLTTLTGLLGPARSVTAMVSTVTPTRSIKGRGNITVTAEDNAQVLIDHGAGVISHVQCGFNYHSASAHDARSQNHHSLTIVGSAGTLALAGYDWAPHGVDLATRDRGGEFQRLAEAPGDYAWENGASLAAEALATGRDLPLTAEHAIHVLEILQAALQSQDTGRRVKMETTFTWPIRGLAAG
jgi:predicted dehydrogenase